MTWAEQELGGASLGDARLSRRLVKLATRLAESPSASIPQACRGWAEMRAAYRFPGPGQAGLARHPAAALGRDGTAHARAPVVLCLQDTTELDFEGKATRGLGPLSYEAQRGDVLASDLCGHAGPGAAGRDGCVDVGARVQGPGRPSARAVRACAG